MGGHLVALVPGQGPGQRRGQGGDLGRQDVSDQVGAVPCGQRHQHHEPGRPLHQSGDRAHVFAEDQVAFPVPGHRPVRCLGGTCGDVEDAGPQDAPVGLTGSRRAAGGPPCAQMSGHYRVEGGSTCRRRPIPPLRAKTACPLLPRLREACSPSPTPPAVTHDRVASSCARFIAHAPGRLPDDLGLELRTRSSSMHGSARPVRRRRLGEAGTDRDDAARGRSGAGTERRPLGRNFCPRLVLSAALRRCGADKPARHPEDRPAGSGRRARGLLRRGLR